MVDDYNYVYRWKNNPVRVNLYKRKCKVIARGRMNTVLIEFENGERVTTSRYAILKCSMGGQDLKSL